MSCQCDFTLSRYPKRFLKTYTEEKYSLSCTDSVNFLRQILQPGESEVDISVKYELRKNTGFETVSYKSYGNETLSFAAAKIELFAKNKKFHGPTRIYPSH